MILNQNWHGTLIRHLLLLVTGCLLVGLISLAPVEQDTWWQQSQLVPHFLMVMSVLASTDLVAMLPSRLVRGNPALQVVDAPLQVPGRGCRRVCRCGAVPRLLLGQLEHQVLREVL